MAHRIRTDEASTERVGGVVPIGTVLGALLQRYEQDWARHHVPGGDGTDETTACEREQGLRTIGISSCPATV